MINRFSNPRFLIATSGSVKPANGRNERVEVLRRLRAQSAVPFERASELGGISAGILADVRAYSFE